MTPQEIAASIKVRDLAWLTEVALIVATELRRRERTWNAPPDRAPAIEDHQRALSRED